MKRWNNFAILVDSDRQLGGGLSGTLTSPILRLPTRFGFGWCGAPSVLHWWGGVRLGRSTGVADARLARAGQAP